MPEFTNRDFVMRCTELASEGIVSCPICDYEWYTEAAIWEKFLRETLQLWGESVESSGGLTYKIRDYRRRQHKREIWKLEDRIRELEQEKDKQ